MEKILSGVIAGLVVALAVAAPAAAAPATVTVRVEGESRTLVPRTQVTTTTIGVGLPGQPTCSGTSALGALHLATGGNWGGTYYAFTPPGYFVDTVLGEGYDLAAPRYWSFWLNNESSMSGACAEELEPSDEVLFFVECTDSADACPRLPLRLSGVPATAPSGQVVALRVEEFTPAGAASAAAGATVTAGGQTATTGADGTARLTLTGAGPITVTATKPARVRDGVATCVTSGTDGACGTGTGSLAPGPARPGTPGAALDKTAPRASFAGLRMGRRYARGKGPRLIRGTIAADPSGLARVALSLTRERRGKSWFFSGRSERFRRQPRGRSVFFSIGDRQDWSYLLPRRLATGRYTIKVAATDKAGNRAETRVVIRVR